jgi:hypothetical protein
MKVPYYIEYLSKVMDLAYKTAMKGGAPKQEEETDGEAGESKEVSPAYILTDSDVEEIYQERKKEGKE